MNAGVMYPGQGAMLQMQMMGAMGGMNNNSPASFYFAGNSLSIQSRVEAMPEDELNQIVDANLTITGMEIKPYSCWGYICTIIWGSILIFPIFFICCAWWQRCVYPAYDIPYSVYESLGKLFRGGSLRNVTLNITDNTFDQAKAQLLYNFISSSKISGFTLINSAGPYNFKGNEYSNFLANMQPIKNLPLVMSDLRWSDNIYM